MQKGYRIKMHSKALSSLPGYRLRTGTNVYLCINPNTQTAEVSNDNFRIQSKYPELHKALTEDATILLTAAIRITGDAYDAYHVVKSLL